MEKKRSIGVTVFGFLIVIFALFPVVILFRAFIEPLRKVSFGGAFMYIAMALALFFLALGIFRLKNWARVICLWLSYIWGLAVISIGFSLGTGLYLLSKPTEFVVLGILFYALIIFVPIIFFLHHPNIKKQFK